MDAVFWITVGVMVVGLVGVVVPGLPGVSLIFLAALAYGWATDFATVGAGVLVLLGVFAVLAMVSDYVATAYGARRFGASNWGAIGGAVGGVVGVLAGLVLPGIGSLIGLLLGSIGGVFVGEYLRRRRGGPQEETGLERAARGDWRQTFRAAGGVLVGYLISVAVQGVLAVAAVVVFLIAAL